MIYEVISNNLSPENKIYWSICTLEDATKTLINTHHFCKVKNSLSLLC